MCHLLHFMHKGAVLPHRKRYSVTFWSRGVFWGAESESGRIFLIPPPWGRIQGGGKRGILQNRLITMCEMSKKGFKGMLIKNPEEFF